MNDRTVDHVDLVQRTQGQTTVTLDKVGFGAVRFLIAKGADDDAGKMDELGLDFKNARRGVELRLDAVRWCPKCHERTSELDQKQLTLLNSYIVVALSCGVAGGQQCLQEMLNSILIL